MGALLSLVALPQVLSHRRQAACILAHGVGARVGRGERVVVLAGGVAGRVGGPNALPGVPRPVTIA